MELILQSLKKHYAELAQKQADVITSVPDQPLHLNINLASLSALPGSIHYYRLYSFDNPGASTISCSRSMRTLQSKMCCLETMSREQGPSPNFPMPRNPKSLNLYIYKLDQKPEKARP